MHRLRLDKCSVTDGIDLSEATTRTLDLRGCHVGAIYLYRATINGPSTSAARTWMARAGLPWTPKG